MKKNLKIILALLIAILCLFSACGGPYKSTTEARTSTARDAGRSASGYGSEKSAVLESSGASAAETDTGFASSASGSTESSGQPVTDPTRKLVKYQYLTMETKEFDNLNSWIQEHVKSAGGYIENSSVSGTSASSISTRNASYVIRIPADIMDTFITELQGEGTVTYRSENVEDVTLNYMDTESHITALKTEQETLLNMLSQSSDLETLLAIQDRLTDIRYQLENYESQLRLYDNDIEYSTITLDIREVDRETAVEGGSFGSQLKERLSSNFYSLGKGLQSFALWFLGALPFWLLLGALAVITIVIIKLIRKKRTKTTNNRTKAIEQEDRHLPPK